MNPALDWLTSPEWTHVVGALLHSLWQGAIIAIALAVLMHRLTNPVTRYRCALITLGLMVMAGLMTWAVLTAPKSAVPVAITIPVNKPAVAPVATAALNPDSGDKLVALGRMTLPPAPKYWIAWIAIVWMLGAVAMLLRAGIKIAGAENLRRSCQPLNDEGVLALIAEARHAVGLARQIRVAVTDRLTSPAVVGVIVPTLILPLSLFTALTPEQIRFILLHELAHIRRGDYFANLFQLLTEALLFFNPAVWWISHQIRREREACCDALAIELSGAPADYARTLVRVAENILHPTANAALAFGDERRVPSSLADRVQRLLVPGYRPALRLTWRAMLASLIVGGALLVLSAVGTRSTVGAILSPREKTAAEPLISSPVTNFGNNNTTMPVPATLTGILTDPQFREVVKAIDQRSGIKSPNEDQVTQLRDRRAQVLISAVDKNSIATEIESQPGHIGAAETTPGSITYQATNIHATNSNQHLTNVAALNDSRRAIIRKLKTISLDQVPFDQQPLREVIRVLSADTLAHDPWGQGINYTLNGVSAPVAPAFDWEASFVAEDKNPVLVTIKPEIRGATLEIILDTIVRGADKPIKYSIVGDTVAFSLKSESDPEPRAEPVAVPLTNGIYQTRSLSQSAEKGREVISQKLEQIKFDKVIYRGLSLFEVVRSLNDDARMRDPDQKGINFIVDPNIPGGTNQISLTNSPTINMDKEAIGLTLREVLDEIVKGTSAKIHYSIEDYAVIFGLGDPIEPLQMRTFNLDLNLVSAALGVPTLARPTNGSQADSNLAVDTQTNRASGLLGALRERMRGTGVDIDRPGVAIFLNGRERQGKLLVNATKKDLDTIESLLVVINTPPPQVNIKVQWVVVPQSLVGSMFQEFFTNTVPSSISRTQNLFGVLTEKQMAEVQPRIDFGDGITHLSQGDVTTLSGRQCQIQTVEMKTIVTGINPKALTPPGVTSTNNSGSEFLETKLTPFGPVLDVVPFVDHDSAKISLVVIASLTEFAGYDKPTSKAPYIYVNGKRKKGLVPLPRYRLHQMTNNCAIRDGETLLLGNPPTAEVTKQSNGEFLTTDVTGTKTNYLLVFVTPTIVDPAGNRVNPDSKSLPSSSPNLK